MKLTSLAQRRFDVLLGACFLGAAFIGVVWCLMLLLKALNPVTFHFNLLMDILPWLTPVLIILVLFGPLYWKVAGLLAPPSGGLQRLAQARYNLIAGSFFYLLVYTLAIWLGMNLLGVWDIQAFHFNLLVDWLPAIVPPWLGWVVGAPLVWKILGPLDQKRPVYRWHGPDKSLVATLLVFGGALLSGGGLLLNQGAYAVTQGQSLAVAHNLIGLGVVVFSLGGIVWASMLVVLWRWRRGEELPVETNPVDRLRATRGRTLAHGFAVISVVFGLVALIMAGFQAMDPFDFHFYLALDIWSVGVPLFLGWLLLAMASSLLPNWLAQRDPARFAIGVGAAPGPSGPLPEPSWGYAEVVAAASRSRT
ncbi:MAG: hypothetical protein ACREN7_04610 [Candidatus Dormibacteria bacterium]